MKPIVAKAKIRCKLCGEVHILYPGKTAPYYTCEGPLGKRDRRLHRHYLKEGDEVEYQKVHNA